MTMPIWPGGPQLKIAGVPLRVSPLFVVLALFAAFNATRHLSKTALAPTPPMPSTDDLAAVGAWLQRYGTPEVIVTRASPGWVLVTGAGVAIAFALSVLIHELGHLFAARAAGIDVAAVDLNAFGGFVEIDDDRLTPGRLAFIVAAGPAATLAVLVNAIFATHGLSPASDTSAGLAIERIAAYAIGFNAFALALNLLPIRPLDGGQLLGAARLRFRRKVDQ
jgi:Zn-dependent protease